MLHLYISPYHNTKVLWTSFEHLSTIMQMPPSHTSDHYYFAAQCRFNTFMTLDLEKETCKLINFLKNVNNFKL